jgi:hypothetical protein
LQISPANEKHEPACLTNKQENFDKIHTDNVLKRSGHYISRPNLRCGAKVWPIQFLEKNEEQGMKKVGFILSQGV